MRSIETTPPINALPYRRVFPAVPAATDPPSRPAEGVQEESLVADARSGLTPAQMVERKLVSLLRSKPLPVSHLMTESRNRRSR